MRKLGVVGIGKVGSAVVDLFSEHYDVITYDKYKDSNSISDFKNVNYAVICVPTPGLGNGKCDTSIVEEVVESFSIDHFLVKSAVPPGTTERLSEVYGSNICVSPEYIGEGGYVVPFWKGYPDPKDMKKHQFQIFGGEREETNRWVEIFQKVLGPEPEYIQTDSRTAELTKYVENVWIATKVTFVNEIFNIAKQLDVDYRELRELWLLDKRVSRMHTSVFENDRGFGGKCLPKDLKAIITQAREEGYNPELLESVLEVNDKICKSQ